MNLAALILFALAGVGLLLVGAQLASLRRHLRQPLMLKEKFSWRCVFAVPPKDLLVAAFWICGLLSNKVNWRGNQFLVLKGTRLVPAGSLPGPENPDFASIPAPASIPYRSFG